MPQFIARFLEHMIMSIAETFFFTNSKLSPERSK